jgi:multidrug efflux system outer membrane protein
LRHSRCNAKTKSTERGNSATDIITTLVACLQRPVDGYTRGHADRENIDIKIAATRVTEARAIARQAHARYFPELNLTGSSTRGNTQPGSTEAVTISRGGFDAAWEVDLFGSVRADNAAAIARARAANSDAQNIRNTVLTDLLRAIIEWRQATQTARATTALLAAQDEQINLFSIRVAAGLIDNTLVTRARRPGRRQNRSVAKA